MIETNIFFVTEHMLKNIVFMKMNTLFHNWEIHIDRHKLKLYKNIDDNNHINTWSTYPITTQRDLNKMAAISQTTFSDTFYWKKKFVFCLNFHWC